MAVRRKVFRIEEMRLANHARRAVSSADNLVASTRNQLPVLHAYSEQAVTPFPRDNIGAADSLRQLKQETDSISRAIRETKQEIAALYDCALTSTGNSIRRELDAVVGAAEHAIQQILSAAEDIDEAANTLTAMLKRDQDQALAQDIRDQVVRIFEACNFHDLAGQRISKVLATLQFVDGRIARMMEIWGGIEQFREHADAPPTGHEQAEAPLHGPKLDGEPGHASQADIDALFAAM